MRCLFVALWGLCLMVGAYAQPAGIGVQITRAPQGLLILQVAPGGPAERAGLKADEVIVAVDDKPVSNYDDEAATGLIRGKAGSTVRLTIAAANGSGRTVQIRRATTASMPVRTRPQPASSRVTFAPWIDPTERGFRVDVPRGWRVSGGTHWKGPTDARQFVRVQSPDGKISVFVDDPDILPRTVPHAVYGSEGSVIQLASGPTLLQRFLTGSQFAQEHVRTRLCPKARFTNARDDEALSARMTEAVQPFARQMGVTARVSTGQAGFFCGSDIGMALSTTVIAASRNGPMQPWGVLKVSGFTALDPARAIQARYVMEHMVHSMQVDPAWQRNYAKRIRDVTGSTIAMQNAVTAQVQRRSAENDAMLARLNNPNAGVAQREEREGSSVNSTLGTKDVCDAIGRCQNVSNDHDDYFMDHGGNVAVGRAGGAPPDDSGVWTPTYTR